MSHALLLVPDLLLIVVGFLLCRHTLLDRPVWDAVERLTYFLLFPVLLFSSIAKSPLHPAQTAALAGVGVGTVLCGIGLAYAIRRWPGVDARLHASGAQTAFRFNSYIALALAERLGGAETLALMALLIALCVPICNIGAVWPLARHGGHAYVRELVRNPFILGTLAGLLFNLAGLHLPDTVGTTLHRLGLAAIPLGLMAVGAGLKLGGLQAAPALAAAFLTIRHVALPAIALALSIWVGLPPLQQAVVLAFAALPTASSAYVLAMRMGGHGPFVAGLVTMSTLLGMVSVPVWLAIGARL
ncbi:MAG: AEC family transporter [Rhizobacter sp.]|nr:AEC family transporter [Rhizobacter sp.]MBP6269887.1 AEC family transporter [Rhizobacter sp.]